MYKVVVVSGPLRGNSYSLQDGENILGRATTSQVVLPSAKVSKKHCTLNVKGDQVFVRDEGSSNGTFVNGTLTKLKPLKSGDRISLGEHVLEIVKLVTTVKKVSGGGSVGLDVSVMAGLPLSMPASPPNFGKVLPFPGNSLGNTMAMGAPAGLNGLSQTPSSTETVKAPPKDLIERMKALFERYVINFLFTLNEKHEWANLTRSLVFILVLVTAAVGVFPIIDKTQDLLLVEARNRAQSLARLIVDRNTTAILEKSESKIDVSFAEKENSILAVYIVDMDNRILAPAKRVNQNLSDGQEGRFSNLTRRWFEKYEDAQNFSMPRWAKDGSLDVAYPALTGNVLGYAEPIKILDPTKGKNVVVALALVFYDLNRILLDEATGLIMYLTAVILGCIIAVGVYISIYRLTLRPLDHINRELDRAMRGDIMVIENPFKFKEINPLIETLNLAMAKVNAAPGAGNAAGGTDGEEFIGFMKAVCKMSPVATMILRGDRRIEYLNSAMEEVTGMRNESVMGQPFDLGVNDQSFILMVNDLLTRCVVGSTDGVTESLEFSGTSYGVELLALGSPGAEAKGYVLSLRGGA